jgi:hypothetical protein
MRKSYRQFYRGAGMLRYGNLHSELIIMKKLFALFVFLAFGTSAFAQNVESKPSFGLGATFGFPSFLALSAQVYAGDSTFELNLSPVGQGVIIDAKARYTINRQAGNTLHLFGEVASGINQDSISNRLILAAGFGFTFPLNNVFGNNLVNTIDLGVSAVPGFGPSFALGWGLHYRF